MAKNKNSMVGQRIRWALNRRNLSAAEMGRHLGISRSAVCQWWSRIQPTAPLDKLHEIAEYLGVQMQWLVTGKGEPFRTGGAGRVNKVGVSSASSAAVKLAYAPVIGIIEAGTWKEGPAMSYLMSHPPDDAPTIPTLHQPDMPHVAQYAVQMGDKSANETIVDGEWVVYCEYHDARPDGPQGGDLVVAEKKFDGLYNTIIGRLRLVAGSWEIHFESTQSRWRNNPIRLSRNLTIDVHDGSTVKIIGYVLGAMRTNMQPQAKKSVSLLDRARVVVTQHVERVLLTPKKA